jgi:hypothetical protein
MLLFVMQKVSFIYSLSVEEKKLYTKTHGIAINTNEWYYMKDYNFTKNHKKTNKFEVNMIEKHLFQILIID